MMFDAFKRLIQRLDQSVVERELRLRAAKREPLTDAEFAKRYFSDNDEQQVPIAVARVVREQLRIENIAPEDNLAAAFPDIPFDEVVKDVLEQLGIPERSFNFQTLDGTVGNLVDALSVFRRTHP